MYNFIAGIYKQIIRCVVPLKLTNYDVKMKNILETYKTLFNTLKSKKQKQKNNRKWGLPSTRRKYEQTIFIDIIINSCLKLAKNVLNY